MKSRPNQRGRCQRIEACILAGGLSSRMGRDKARMRLGRRTMLGWIRSTAQAAGFPTRVIRRDLVPRCGPLGGVYTALKTSRAEAVIVLACDMPLVSAALLHRLQAQFDQHGRAVFVRQEGAVGFPLLLPRAGLERVEAQMAQGHFSLQSLARSLRARGLKLAAKQAQELVNVNTPEDWALLLDVLFRCKQCEQAD